MVEQVGGDHYKTDYQHWDWVIDINLPYLEANATKYVSRWWKKGGVADLEKARSYVLKLKSGVDAGKIGPRRKTLIRDDKCLVLFIQNYGLTPDEVGFCYLMSSWTTIVQIEEAEQLLLKIIADATAGAVRAVAPGATYPQANAPSGLGGQVAGTTEAMD